MIIQLTHSGRYSKPAGIPAPIIAQHSAVLDPKMNLTKEYPLVTDDYLDKLQDKYVEAAQLALEAGFDGVDIKSCHGYLLSELLGSHLREGKYGGSFENRTRMLRETLIKVKKEVPKLILATRLNAFDAYEYPYAWGVNKENCLIPDLSEPLELIKELKNIGIGIINISIGNPYYNPHIGRPYDFPIKGIQPPQEHPMAGVARFINIYGTIQKEFPEIPIVGSGLGWLRHFMPLVAAGIIKKGMATLIGQGRGMFAYPDSVNDIIKKGQMDPYKCCVSCSACTQIMRDGGQTGCVVRDSEIYGLQYRTARRFSLDRLQEEAKRCRTCINSNCSVACPAHVDIPSFINAFLNSNIKEAYQIIRKSNVLPEMTAYVCPVSEQCEGNCIENIFCENPVAISDIQLIVAKAARLMGITQVALPQNLSKKSVGIIGGGPAGISCAIKLLEMGHSVSIYEKTTKLGGVPLWIIPEHRYISAEEEINSILKNAIENKLCNVFYKKALGVNIKLNELLKKHDAILLSFGLDGENKDSKKGIVNAITFLSKVKSKKIKKLPDKVAVIGGGNTAIDAAITAKRLGCKDVYLVYRRSFNQMPAWKEERKELVDIGIHLLILTQPKGYVFKNNKLKGIKIVRTKLGEPDQSQRRQVEIIPNSESILECDMVIEAIGQKLSSQTLKALNGILINNKNLIEINGDNFSTNKEGIFAAGDCVNGGETVVRAVYEGMKAAEKIDEYLKQNSLKNK